MGDFDEYLFDLKLDPAKGSRLPVQERSLVWKEVPKERYWDTSPPEYEADTKPGLRYTGKDEDIWLFDIHTVLGDPSTNAEITFAIGPYLWRYSLRWEWFEEIRAHENMIKWLEVDKKDDKGWGNHWIAIRTPKMVNPAITISATRGYAAVRKVCQIVRMSYDDKHQYIGVKTSGFLTGKFAERHKDASWWNQTPWLQGVDVNERAITLFPKQMYGTDGKRYKLYEKFITTNDDDKDRKLSEAHLSQASAYTASKGKKLKAWMWFRDYPTIIQGTYFDEAYQKRMPYGQRGGADQDTGFGWSDFEKYSEFKADGFQFMLNLFGSISGVVENVLTGNFFGAGSQAVQNILKQAKPEKVKDNANLNGFVSAVSRIEGVNLEINGRTVPELREKYKNGGITGYDFFLKSEAQ